MNRWNSRYLSILAALTIFVVQPSTAQAETDRFEIERCFKHDSETLEGSIILQAAGEAVQGIEFGTVRTAEGETWGYSAGLEGSSVGGMLSLSQTLVVDGSAQSQDVAWRVGGGMLTVSEGIAYAATPCAPLWAAFAARDLSSVSPIRPLSPRPGQLFSFELDTALTGFKPYEVGFETPDDGIARAEFESDPFFAIILKSAPLCSFSEEDRLEVQEQFPSHKVFTSRFSCGEDIELITYTNVSEESAFIAVLAAEGRSEAMDLLAEIEAEERFPGANLREMRAVLVYP